MIQHFLCCYIFLIYLFIYLFIYSALLGQMETFTSIVLI